MGRIRILQPKGQGACFHALSRIVERRFYFGRDEKEFFVATLRKLEAFLDVKVLTYCVMSNHFHLLVEIPPADGVHRLTAASLLQRLPLLYHDEALENARDEIARALAYASKPGGNASWIDAIIARYQARMGDLSVFLKELKWRFSRWYNACRDRVGTLWEDRFRSVLVQGREHALMTVAAYIDLNPVRAEIVVDPKDYRWCGYGEAVAGKKIARERLARMHGRLRSWQGMGRSPVVGWREMGPAYRMYLFGQGIARVADGRTGRGARAGFDPATVSRVIDGEGGKLPLHVVLRTRIDHFRDGLAIGTSDFVDEVAASRSAKDGEANERRKSRAVALPEADFGGLMTLRRPRQSRQRTVSE